MMTKQTWLPEPNANKAEKRGNSGAPEEIYVAEYQKFKSSRDDGLRRRGDLLGVAEDGTYSFICVIAERCQIGIVGEKRPATSLRPR